MMKISFRVGLGFMSGVWLSAAFAASSSPSPTPSPAACSSAREYVTTLEFLRSEKDLALPEVEARKIAQQVSKNCTGAAGRFIQAAAVLNRASAGGKNSLKEALDIASRSEAEAETYFSVFRRAYSEDDLDLDVQTSIRLARELSLEFSGDQKNVRKDFERLVRFCVEESELNLPRPQCARTAARVARLGQPFQGGVAEKFISAFDFLRSPKGPSLVTAQALEVAEEVIGRGPEGFENFKKAYSYAVSEKGLGLARNEAIGFAREIASYSLQKRSANP